MTISELDSDITTMLSQRETYNTQQFCDKCNKIKSEWQSLKYGNDYVLDYDTEKSIECKINTLFAYYTSLLLSELKSSHNYKWLGAIFDCDEMQESNCFAVSSFGLTEFLDSLDESLVANSKSLCKKFTSFMRNTGLAQIEDGDLILGS